MQLVKLNIIGISRKQGAKIPNNYKVNIAFKDLRVTVSENIIQVWCLG